MCATLEILNDYPNYYTDVPEVQASGAAALYGADFRFLENLVHDLVPYIGRRNLDPPAFYPYYQAAEELGVPLFCHPNSNGELTDRFDNFFKTHVLGRVMNCTPALVALDGATAWQGMKLSFFSCLRNWVPFLVYGLIGIGLMIAAVLVFGALALLFGASAMVGGGGWGALLGLVLLFIVVSAIFALVLGPIVFGSQYAGYKDTLAVEEGPLTSAPTIVPSSF